MNKSILITSYVNPDLDGVACTYSYADFLNKMGINATPAIYGSLNEEIIYVIKTYDVKLDTENKDPKNFRRVILVDTSNVESINPLINPENVVEVIDHRKVNYAEAFPNAKIQIELVGAAATLIGEKYQRKKIEPSRNSAVLLYGAIVSNTLDFQANVTTDRDKALASYLKKTFSLPDTFAHTMFRAKSDFSGDKLINTIRGDFANFKSHSFGGKQMGIAQIETINGATLARTRKNDIISEIETIMSELCIDICFLTIVDLEANQNVFVAPTKEIEQLLTDVLGVTFHDHIALRPKFIMRKEIVPLIKDRLS